MIQKKNLLILIVILLCASLSLGMGGLSEGPRRIPTPDKNFTATIIDQADVSTQVAMLSIDGLTYFIGDRGKGKVAVPFAQIKQADFSMGPHDLQVLLSLKDGTSVSMTADRHLKCTGVSSIGNFQISLGDIKILIINGQVLPQ